MPASCNVRAAGTRASAASNASASKAATASGAFQSEHCAGEALPHCLAEHRAAQNCGGGYAGQRIARAGNVGDMPWSRRQDRKDTCFIEGHYRSPAARQHGSLQPQLLQGPCQIHCCCLGSEAGQRAGLARIEEQAG